MLERLASGDEERRIDSLVRICALLRDEPGAIETQVVTPLGAILQRDSSPVVRALAARALEICAGNPGGGRGDEAAAALLAALGKERELAVRKAIIYALARYPQPQVTSALIPFLKNKHTEVPGRGGLCPGREWRPDLCESFGRTIAEGRPKTKSRSRVARRRAVLARSAVMMRLIC